MAYSFCAIAPLDQAVTQLGWGVGTFARSPCPLLGVCTSRSEGLQFIADAGTPVVAPFPASVTRDGSGLVLTLNFPVPAGISAPPARVRVRGINVAAPVGPVELGGLLGRVAPGSRPAATFELVGGGDIAVLFRDMGLDVVGAERPTVRGYRLTPMLGGRLLARSGGPADCAARTGMQGLRGLRGLGAPVPAGYVEPDQGVYSRFGTSRLSNRNASPPPDDVPAAPTWAKGVGLAAWVGIGAVMYWVMRPGGGR